MRNAAPDIQRALAAAPDERGGAVITRAFELRRQTDARILVGNRALVPADGGTPPGFVADTDDLHGHAVGGADRRARR